MKTFLLLIVIIITAVSAACAEQTQVYDSNWNFEYRVQEDGCIYDRDGKLQGSVRHDKVHDKDWNQKYKVKGNNI